MECPKNLLVKTYFSEVLEFPFGMSHKDAKEKLREKYIQTLNDYYLGNRGIKNVGSQSSLLPFELLRNAYHHGGLKDPSQIDKNRIFLGFFGSLEAFVIGCDDGGDYFRQTKIKTRWESQDVIKSEKIKEDPPIGHIWLRQDGKIYVQVETGTIFLKVDPKIYASSNRKSNGM